MGDKRIDKTDDALIKRARLLLSKVKCDEYLFVVAKGHGGVYLRAEYVDRDVYTKRLALQQTRKWILSPFMTNSEIVATAFKCCHTSFEHRVREAFTYRGRRIFGPHFDIEDLHRLCKRRENAGGRQPRSR
jgi:hypothetical protein